MKCKSHLSKRGINADVFIRKEDIGHTQDKFLFLGSGAQPNT